MAKGAQALALYEHVDALLTVMDWMDENAAAIEAAGGVLPPELEELLDQVSADTQEKIRRVCLMERTLEASEKAAKLEATRLAAMAKGWDTKRTRLRTYLAMQLRRMGETRVDFPTVKVRRQVSGTPGVEAVDEAAVEVFGELIPAHYEFQASKALKRLQEEDLVVDLKDPDGEWQEDGSFVDSQGRRAERQPDGALVQNVGALGVRLRWSEFVVVW